jgi:uncharacterized membrane protein
MTEAGYSNLFPSCITSFGLYTRKSLIPGIIFLRWRKKSEGNLKKATGREFEKPKIWLMPAM